MKTNLTCGQRLDAAKLVVDQLESISDVAIKTGTSKDSINNWAKLYRKHGKDHRMFGWGDPLYTDVKRIFYEKRPISPDTPSEVPLSEILNQLGQQVNALQNTVFEAQTRFEEAFRMIK